MTLRLDRLAAFNAIGWQRHCERIETAFASQDTINAALASQLAQIVAAQAAATAAQAAATAATADAVAAARESARINSYPNPGSILSAVDAGTTATITIANHTRVYPVEGSIDVPDVAITGGTLTGVTSAARVWVYYDDTTLASTTPTFQWTTNSATAQVGAAAGRHILGFIDTPVAGSAATSSGTGGGTPGGGGGAGGYGGGGGGAIP